MKVTFLTNEDSKIINDELNSKINSLKDSGGVGYVEPTKSLTWDGNTEGLTVIGGSLYKISDEVLDVDSINSITYVTSNYGEYTSKTITKDELYLQPEPGMLMLYNYLYFTHR